jgi:hypothetical protein
LSKTRYLYATAPDGAVVRRRTDNEYAFAVLVAGKDIGSPWTAPSWSSRRDLAEKAAARFRGFGYRVVVAPARETKEEA